MLSAKREEHKRSHPRDPLHRCSPSVTTAFEERIGLAPWVTTNRWGSGGTEQARQAPRVEGRLQPGAGPNTTYCKPCSQSRRTVVGLTPTVGRPRALDRNRTRVLLFTRQVHKPAYATKAYRLSDSNRH